MQSDKRGDRNDFVRKPMMKTDPPRTGLFEHEDRTMKLPPDNDNAAALALTAFGNDDPGNANEGVLGLVDSLAFTHGGDTVIASGDRPRRIIRSL